MAAQGQSWFTASGDNVTLLASGPWPEEDANIIAVGGTDLVTNGPGGSWKSEPGWNYSASGPSVDKQIKIEPYQLPYINKENKGSRKLRNVSDVSANADFDMMICAQGSCQGGWGGTSFPSPIWAGFAALANQHAVSLGKPEIGFINPILYPAYSNNTKMTHDIIGNASGNYPAVKGLTSLWPRLPRRGMNTIKAMTRFNSPRRGRSGVRRVHGDGDLIFLIATIHSPAQRAGISASVAPRVSNSTLL